MSRPFFLNLAVLGVALCSAMIAHAQDKPADFTSQTPLALSGQGPWYRLELPLAVQLEARDRNLGDLRIFNRDGQAQAYALAQQAPNQEQVSTSVKWFPLYTTVDASDAAPVVRIERSASGSIIDVQPQSDIEAGEEILRGWLLDASAINAPLEQLVIDWNTEREGFQHFSVEASDDLQHWQPWGEGQVARLSFSDELVEQREVGLPGQSARYLRLLWHSPSNAPVLTSALVLSASTDSPSRPLTWAPAAIGKSEKPNEYLWQLPVGLPVERVKIAIAQPNSLAPGMLYGRSSDQEPWQLVSSGLLYRLTQSSGEMVQDQLQLAGQVVRQLKLEVDDRGGGLGAEAPELSVAAQATQVVFLAQGEGPFMLAVGNAQAKAADMPLTTLIPDFAPQRLVTLGTAQLVPAQPTQAQLTPAQLAETQLTGTQLTREQTANVATAPVAVPVVERTDYKRLGLWAVLVFGALALGWMAFTSLRAPTSRR